MAESKYSVVRFVSDPVRVEPVNIGLVLHSPQERFLAFEFDLRRAASKMARPDKETVRHFSEQLELVENHDIDWERARFETIPVADPGFLDKVSDYIGNKIVFEPPRGCDAVDLDDLFVDLFERFVAVTPRHLRITKRSVVRDVKEEFRGRGVGEYIKTRPTVTGEHRDYTLPLGIRHERRTYVEVLKLGAGQDKSYRAMAAVGRLWQDAQKIPSNRHADLSVVVHYERERLREGESLLQDDGINVFLSPHALLQSVPIERVRNWA